MLASARTFGQETGLGPKGQANAGCCRARVPRNDQARRSAGCRPTLPDRRQRRGRGACRPSRRTRPRRRRGRRQHLVLRPRRPVWADDGPAAHRLRSGRCRPGTKPCPFSTTRSCSRWPPVCLPGRSSHGVARSWSPRSAWNRSCARNVDAFLGPISCAAPALGVYFAARGLSEGLGVTWPTMAFGLAGLILLIPLGYVLMYGAFGLPGQEHAAAVLPMPWSVGPWRPATSHSSASAPCYPGLVWHRARRRFHAATLLPILRLGLPMAGSILMEAEHVLHRRTDDQRLGR